MRQHGNRPTLKWAQDKFAACGVTLLAETYKNNSTRMPYLCICGDTHEDSLANITKRGILGCDKRRSWSLSEVQDVYLEADCILLEDEYKNANTLMRFECSCGKESATTFANFHHHDVRCFDCGKDKIAGANNYQWVEDRESIRRVGGRDARAWRNAIFIRDDFTCQKCGVRGKNLNAHHIHDYQHHPDMALESDNGATLCKPCHIEFHQIFGARKRNDQQQFNQFLGGYHGC